MRSRHAWTAAFALAIGAVSPTAASAQQTLNLSAGYFAVRGEDARVDGDVLVENRNLFLFDFNDFNSASIGVRVAAADSAIFSRPAPACTSRHGAWTRSTTTTSAPMAPRSSSSSSCAIVPLSATIRVLPLGRQRARFSRTSAAASASTSGDMRRPATSSTSRQPGARSSGRAIVATGTVDWAGRRLRRARCRSET